MALNFSAIKDCAEGLLISAGVSGVYPVPLERVVQYIGFQSLAFDGDPEISGAVKYEEKKIFINQNESPQRQRFTLAHEIGHAMLHKGESIIDYRATMDSPDPDNQKETQANQFAAHLLMPENDFVHVWRTRAGDVKRIAAYFGVSEPAASIRLKTLKLA